MNLNYNKVKQDLRRCEKRCRLLEAQSSTEDVERLSKENAELAAKLKEAEDQLKGKNMEVGRLKAQLKRMKKEKDDA